MGGWTGKRRTNVGSEGPGECSKDMGGKRCRRGQRARTKLGGGKVREDEQRRYEKDKEKRDMEELRVQRVGFFPGA